MVNLVSDSLLQPFLITLYAILLLQSQLQHYKKSDVWIQDWIMAIDAGLRDIYCNKTDFLIGVTTDEELVKLSPSDGLSYFQMRQSKFTDFCLIYPTASHIVALSQNSFLHVFDVENGNWVRNNYSYILGF